MQSVATRSQTGRRGHLCVLSQGAQRNKDKLVSLLDQQLLEFEEDGWDIEASTSVTTEPSYLQDTLLQLQPQVPAIQQPCTTGRVAIYCTAESFDVDGLAEHLRIQVTKLVHETHVMPVSMFIGAPECYESIGWTSGPPASSK